MTNATIIDLVSRMKPQCEQNHLQGRRYLFALGGITVRSSRDIQREVNLMACVLECVLDSDLEKIASIACDRTGAYRVEVITEFNSPTNTVPLARKVSDLLASLGGGHNGVTVGSDGSDAAQWWENWAVDGCIPGSPLRVIV